MTTIHALLIGIDCYLPNSLPGGGCYGNLQGCVRDISLVEQYLRERRGVPAARILKLTSTKGRAGEPAEPRAQWPTYRNIVAAFRRLASVARPGDQVYIHYSGHGGRATTRYPELKGVGGLDESLVPSDIGDANAQYVRDVELAYLIKKLVDKRLLVTLVLDSCHAGSATRAFGGATVRRTDGAVARGINVVDTSARTAPSVVASDAELIAAWRTSGAGQKRGVRSDSGWLLEPSGYVLLAACRASESAYEFSFDGQPSGGVLTHWLLDSLNQPAADLTFKRIYDRILAKVHVAFPEQTPLLEGEADRVAFGSARVRPRYAVGLLRVDLSNRRVLLHAGEAQGLRPGTLFAIYDSAPADGAEPGTRLALAELTELGAAQSWARLVGRSGPLEQGQQAVLLDRGRTPWESVVSLAEEPPARHDEARARALSKVRRALFKQGRGFLRPAADDETDDFRVVLNRAGEYIILDETGAPLPNLRPALKSGRPDAPARLAGRLIHLTKYKSVRELRNDDSSSSLAGKLSVELATQPAGHAAEGRRGRRPAGAVGGGPVFKEGERLVVRIRNEHSQVLNITVLDLRPDWSITQIYPVRAGLFEPFDPGREVLLPLWAELPPGSEEGLDIIKVFATVGTPNFRWLELPALDKPPATADTRGDFVNKLEKALHPDASAPVRRNSPQTKQAWLSLQLEVRIKAV